MTATATKYRYTSDFKLTKAQHQYLEQLMADDPATVLLEMQQEISNQQLDALAADLEAQEEARKQAWGNKYPKVLGQLPPKPADATSNALEGKKPVPEKAKQKRKGKEKENKGAQ